MKSRFVGIVIVLSVLIMLCIYCATIYYFVGPIDLTSITNIASLGDSFGFLTSIFTGLAFSGMLIAILLQKEELKLQREEIREGRIENRNTIKAHQVNVKLSALNSLISEYENKIEDLKSRPEPKASSNWCDNLEDPEEVRQNEVQTIRELISHYSRRKKAVIREIEGVLSDSGVDLELNHKNWSESLIESISNLK